ncbi:MAG: hypothetical protein ACTSQY_11730 [Candidatus Odinarchaeia archaeon]
MKTNQAGESINIFDINCITKAKNKGTVKYILITYWNKIQNIILRTCLRKYNRLIWWLYRKRLNEKIIKLLLKVRRIYIKEFFMLDSKFYFNKYIVAKTKENSDCIKVEKVYHEFFYHTFITEDTHSLYPDLFIDLKVFEII